MTKCNHCKQDVPEMMIFLLDPEWALREGMVSYNQQELIEELLKGYAVQQNTDRIPRVCEGCFIDLTGMNGDNAKPMTRLRHTMW